MWARRIAGRTSEPPRQAAGRSADARRRCFRRTTGDTTGDTPARSFAALTALGTRKSPPECGRTLGLWTFCQSQAGQHRRGGLLCLQPAFKHAGHHKTQAPQAGRAPSPACWQKQKIEVLQQEIIEEYKLPCHFPQFYSKILSNYEI